MPKNLRAARKRRRDAMRCSRYAESDEVRDARQASNAALQARRRAAETPQDRTTRPADNAPRHRVQRVERQALCRPETRARKNDRSLARRDDPDFIQEPLDGPPDQTCGAPPADLGTKDHPLGTKDHPLGPAQKQPEPGQVASRVPPLLQCSVCSETASSHANLLTHTAAAHPTRLDRVAVGRFGNILAYQETAQLFHCSDCFFTCTAFSKLFKHLLTVHCTRLGGWQPPGGEQEEEGSRSKLLQLHGSVYLCTCGFRSNLKAITVNHLQRTHHFPRPYALHTIRQLRGVPAPPRTEPTDPRVYGGSGQALRQEEKEALAKVLGYRKAHFVCLLCGWKSRTKGFATSHVMSTHKVACPYSCQQCPCAFLLPSQLRHHLNIRHRPGRYGCPYCTFRNFCITTFRKHLHHCRAEEEDKQAGVEDKQGGVEEGEEEKQKQGGVEEKEKGGVEVEEEKQGEVEEEEEKGGVEEKQGGVEEEEEKGGVEEEEEEKGGVEEEEEKGGVEKEEEKGGVEEEEKRGCGEAGDG